MLSRKSLKATFEETALPHVGAVYRFARYLCGNEGDAEDIAQECFHQAYRKFHQFRAGTNCKAWLFRITRNAQIDRARQKARQPKTTHLQDVVVETQDDLEQSLLGWQKLASEGVSSLYEVFGDEVYQSLQELPADFRLAVALCDVEDLSYIEIAKILGCPVGTVRSRISRARNFLKEKLYDYAKDLGFARESATRKKGETSYCQMMWPENFRRRPFPASLRRRIRSLRRSFR